MKAMSTFLRNSLFIFFLLSAVPVCAANYYWVGGTGNWSDYNGHWATQSGGQVYYNHAPTPQDTVIFDSLSFIGNNDTVYTNSNTQYCHTMKWLLPDSMPVLYGADPKTKLKIYGSLFLDTAMTWNFGGQLIFFGTDPGNTITTCGKQLGFILFSGDTIASWTLQDTLRCAHLAFRSGNFYSGGNTIVTGTYEQDQINHSRQFLDTSTIYCGVLRNYQNPLQFDADSSTFIVGGWLDGGGLTFGSVILPGATWVTGNNTIEHLTCYGNSSLAGSNTIGTLTGGEPGIVLSLRAGTTQTIADSIDFNGACTGMSAFICTTINSTATIDFLNTAATLDCVFLENVNATGNGATANNSVLINSAGWSVTNVAVQRNLYWVDGTGNWSDTSHWSLSPGGTGGECAPTPIDNVRFDALSFLNPSEYITGDLDVEFCHDMDWTGVANSPAYTQDTGMIMCYGYLQVPQPITAFHANIIMRSAQMNTPVSTGGAILSSITFDGDGGWSMQSTLDAGNIHFINGDFKSSGFDITTGATGFPMESPGNMDFTGSIVSSPLWWVSGVAGNFFAPAVLNTQDLRDHHAHSYNNVQSAGSLELTSSCSYNVVTVAGDGLIKGNNQFDTLQFTAPGVIIHLGAGNTQTITGDFTIVSSCTAPVALESTYSGGTTYISKNSGVINIDYIIMQDIHATGGAIFNATNTCATYNVSGWNVTPPPSGPMYWIGGSGNWNDPNHWSLSSGGAPGICIPNPLTDVYMDVNSFTSAQESVTINCRSAYCRNMDWTGSTGNPSLISISGTNTILSYGSLTLAQGVNTTGGNLTFRSHNTGNTITTVGQPLGYVLFDGIAGDWFLQDTLKCDSINLVNGSVFTGGVNIALLVFRSDTTCARTIDLDTSSVTVGSWFIANDSAMMMNANKVRMTVTGNDFRGGSNRYYDEVTFAGATEITDEDTIRLLRFTGSCDVRTALHADTLYFNNAGQTVTLHSGDTIFVDSAIYSGGNSSAFAGIESSDPITSAYIFKTADTVCLEHLVLNGIHAAGGATYFAGYYSTDIGYNNGWTWTTCYPGMVTVWPGDANYDLVADNLDILAIGIAYGETGTARNNASLTWIAQPANIWSREFADSTDIVHADCNGDGIIGQSDTTAVSLNYGQTHPARMAPPEESQSVTGAELKVLITQAVYQPGDTVTIPILLGTANAPLVDGYGIAFTLNWDESFIEPGTLVFDYSNSWFAPASNNVHLEKPFLSSQVCDFGISRINHADSSGEGILVTMRFVMSASAAGPMKFWFTGQRLINHDEDTLSVTTTGGTINAATGIPEVYAAQATVFPNPSTGEVNVYTNMQGRGTIVLYDLSGRAVMETGAENVSAIRLDLTSFEAGFYYLQISNGEKMVTTQIELVR